MPSRLSQSTSENAHQTLLLKITKIFQEAQVTPASRHQKFHVELFKVHTELSKLREEIQKGVFRTTGESIFRNQFTKHLITVFRYKKGTTAADNIIKLAAGYMKFINEKAFKEQTDTDSDEEDDSTPASRFTARVVKELIEGFSSKEKTVRYRALQTVAEMVSHLGEIDEDTYNALRDALIDRVTDKEATNRSQAVISLAKLCSCEDPSEIEGETALEVLVDAMIGDSSPDVRRTALIHIPINQGTMSAILDRTRDTDVPTRKQVYNYVLERNVTTNDADDAICAGPAHPRILTIAQRELIVRRGLGDRDPSVQAAAGSLIGTWMDVANMDMGIKVLKNGSENPIEDTIVPFLTLFDLGSNTVAADALASAFMTRSEIFDKVQFGDAYWENLTPERAFFARVYVEHCRRNKDEVRLEVVLPVVTVVAFLVQGAYNVYKSIQGGDLQHQDADEQNKAEDEKVNKEFLFSELLKLAVNLDYSDEIGRRKTLQLVREMLREGLLAEQFLNPCLDILRKICGTERDLILIVVETIQELRDAAYGEGDEDDSMAGVDADASADGPLNSKPLRKPVEHMSPEHVAQVDQTELRCLDLCIGMFERVDSTFEENSALDGVLKELIIPSVQRKDILFRNKGLKCLGLCCTIARPLASQSIKLFVNQLSTSPAIIKVTLAQSLFDILMVHEALIFRNQENNLETIKSFLITQIQTEQDPQTKAILCKGTAKLLLSGMISDDEVVKNLIKAYISPLTIGNEELRQSLTFFFPMYSYSSPANQKQMQQIFIHVFLDAAQDRKENKDSGMVAENVTPTQLATMFAEWTDPLRLTQAISRGHSYSMDFNNCVQLDLARDILETLFEQKLKVEIEKEDKRALCQLLNKLHIPDVADESRIRSIKLLMDHLRSSRPLRDSTSNTAFTKFETVFTKRFEKHLEDFSEEEFRKLEEHNALFEFLDSIIPLEEDDELIDTGAAKKRGRKRRSESISTATGAEGHSSRSPERKLKSRPKTKRPRMSASDDSNYSDENGATRVGTPSLAGPTRSLPKRSAASTVPVQTDSSRSEANSKGAPPDSSRRDSNETRYRPSVEAEEAQVDRDINQILDREDIETSSAQYTEDSIMGPEDDDEEEEVNNILAGL